MEQHRRKQGHDYSQPGSYMVTLAVRDREPLLGTLVGSPTPHVELSPLGRELLLNVFPNTINRWPMLEIWRMCIMPDHIHLIIRITAPMPPGKTLGTAIGGLKTGASKALWHQEDTLAAQASTSGGGAPASRGASQPPTRGGADANGRADANQMPLPGRADANKEPLPGRTDASQMPLPGRADANQMPLPGRTDANKEPLPGRTDANQMPLPGRGDANKEPLPGRADAGSVQGTTVPAPAVPPAVPPAAAPTAPPAAPPAAPSPLARRPLFTPGYNDRILWRRNQLQAWRNYLKDNPRRRWLKLQNRHLFTVRREHTFLDYTLQMVGNIFLIDYPDKAAVIYHHYYTNEEFARLVDEWLDCGRRGGVLVSAAVHPREREVMREAFARGYKVIKLHKEGFPDFYKPIGRSFDACAEGRLLEISPWEYKSRREVITREECLFLNRLAQAIACYTEPE